jgi:hypothetical protein
VTERRASGYFFGLTALFVLSLGALACSDMAMEGSAASGDADSGGSGGFGGGASGATGNPAGTSGAGGQAGGAGTSGTGGVPPDPEEELESAFEAPVATDRFVWTANPDSGNVALIDATSYAVRLAEAGFRPTTVAALPSGDGTDGAIVLNEGSHDATILRVDANGDLTSLTLETHEGANAALVAPSGKWALVWTDAKKFKTTELDPADGFQDLTVLHFEGEPTSTVLSVGYRPSKVVFDEAESRAFVVTEPGLNVIELADEPRGTELVELTDDPVDNPAARDVSITPDGETALVRVDGLTTLGIVDLANGHRRSVDLGNFVSDLDLSSDGTSAYAVIGSTASTVSTLVVIPVPVPDDVTLREATVSSVVSRSVSMSPDGSLALMYSNAASNPYLAVLMSEDGWETFEPRALDLKAPVRAAFAAPDGLHGIAFQETAPTSTKRGAFSLIAAEGTRAPKIIGTDAPPISVAFSPEGDTAVITTRDLERAKYGVYLVHLENLEETLVTLPSPPLAAGVVPLAHRAFVAQAHPEGRITFVNLEDGTWKTLTGFELAGRVVE